MGWEAEAGEVRPEEGHETGCNGGGRAQGVSAGRACRTGIQEDGLQSRVWGGHTAQKPPRLSAAHPSAGSADAHRPLSPSPHLVEAERLLSHHFFERTLGRGRPPSPRRLLPPRRKKQPEEQEGAQDRHVLLCEAGAAGKRRGQAGTAGSQKPWGRLDGVMAGVSTGPG